MKVDASWFHRAVVFHCYIVELCLFQEWVDAEADGVMAAAESVVRSIRSLRVAYGLQPKQR